jgi:hypothetical protein
MENEHKYLKLRANSRETGNIGHMTQNKDTTQKTEKMSNMDLTKKPQELITLLQHLGL